MGYKIKGGTKEQEMAWKSLQPYMEDATEAICVKINYQETGLTIENKNQSWHLSCGSLTTFCRGMSLIEQFKNEARGFLYQEVMKVDSLGAMLDCSRNAVPHIDGLKKILTHLARMGYNTVQLYTEDTYQMETIPFLDICEGLIQCKS